MKLKDPIIEKQFKVTFQFDKQTKDNLQALSSMFPYTAPMSVVVRELINSAFKEAVNEGLIVEKD